MRRQPQLELDLSFASRRPWVPGARSVIKWATAALGPAEETSVLSVRVVGRAASRSLNARYRSRKKPTNVLSFAGSGASPDGRLFLGELVICAAVVAVESAVQGKTLMAHWAHITVHGVLHLRGFDHECASDATKMQSMETQILDRLGFSDPYL